MRCVTSDEHDATTVEETREAMEEENARSDYKSSTTAGRGSVCACARVCLCLYVCLHLCLCVCLCECKHVSMGCVYIY